MTVCPSTPGKSFSVRVWRAGIVTPRNFSISVRSFVIVILLTTAKLTVSPNGCKVSGWWPKICATLSTVSQTSRSQDSSRTTLKSGMSLLISRSLLSISAPILLAKTGVDSQLVASPAL